MEAANCLPKSCENKIRHKNGPNNINNETLQNHYCNDVDGGGGGGCGGCCDGDGGGLRNDEDIEALSSQLKDVCAGAAGGPKLFPPTPNGFWIGPNYCENGIDKGKCINNVENEQSSVTVQVVTDSSTTQLDGNFLTMGHPTDDDESSSTSTATTTITTASPGSHADFEIECCASDRNGDDDDEVEKQTTNAETEEEEEDCEIVDRCGPFECTYVSCEPRAVTVNDAGAAAATVEARKPSVASAGSSSHLVTVPMPLPPPPPHQPSCSPLKSSAAAPQLPPPPPGLLQIKFSNRQANNNENASEDDDEIRYEVYTSELQMGVIMRLIQKDLSEPYSIYTYRYFIHNWPKLCFLAMHGTQCVGSIVCKLDLHKKVIRRGYIAMLAVDERYRKRKIGSNLVLQAIQAMIADDADEVVLETEISNKPALRLYENLGFVRDKRLFRYYLNGVDALRLKLWLH